MAKRQPEVAAQDSDIIPVAQDTTYWDTIYDLYYPVMRSTEDIAATLEQNGHNRQADALIRLNQVASDILVEAMPEAVRERFSQRLEAEVAARRMEQLHEFGAALGLSEEEMAQLDELAEALSGPTTVESEEALARA